MEMLTMEQFMSFGMLGAILVGVTHMFAGKAKLFLACNTIAQLFVLYQGWVDQSAYVVFICLMINSINIATLIKEARKNG